MADKEKNIFDLTPEEQKLNADNEWLRAMENDTGPSSVMTGERAVKNPVARPIAFNSKQNKAITG